jgi:hypothetical protein
MPLLWAGFSSPFLSLPCDVPTESARGDSNGITFSISIIYTLGAPTPGQTLALVFGTASTKIRWFFWGFLVPPLRPCFGTLKTTKRGRSGWTFFLKQSNLFVPPLCPKVHRSYKEGIAKPSVVFRTAGCHLRNGTKAAESLEYCSVFERS